MSEQQVDAPQDGKSLAQRLQEPFEPQYVDFLPQSISGSRCLAIAYVDARAVMDRLDDVFGVGGWTARYEPGPDTVLCRLRVKVPGGDWIEHEDVGSYSDQKDRGDRTKAGYSDALKRAAVHLGVGRYLYSLGGDWCDYDPQRKCISKPPRLPLWALPGGTGRPPSPMPRPAPQQPGPPGRPLDATSPPVPPDGIPGDLLSLYVAGREPDSVLTQAEGNALWHLIQAKGVPPADWLRKRGKDTMTDLAASEAWHAMPNILAAKKRPAKKEADGGHAA